MSTPFPCDPSFPIIDPDGTDPHCGCPLHDLRVAEPCDHFVSAGFGAMGDYEHSCFCRTCGFEMADHAECLSADECEERGLDPLIMGIGPDCQHAHGERGLPHIRDCWPVS